MNCPKCKKRLETRRTTVEGAECKREKFCKKCKKRYFTIEMFAEKYEDLMQAHKEKVWELEDLKDKAEDKYNDLTGAIATVVNSIKKQSGRPPGKI